MYKCTECGTEYEIKPDFCDCGNDEFEQIIPEKQEQFSTPAPALAQTVSETVKPQPASAYSEQASTKQAYTPPKAEKRTFSEQYPALSRFIQSLDPISVSIFGLCIVLSFVVIFCLWNVDENNIASSDTSAQNKEVTAKNIPSIDKFWNNTPPAPQPQKTKQEITKPLETAANIVKQVIPTPKPSAQKQTATTVKPVNTQQKAKTTTKPSVTTNTQKKTNTTTSNTSKTNTQPKTTTQTTKTTQPAAQKPVTQTTQATQAPKATQTSAKPAENKTAGITTVPLQKNPTVSTVSQVNTAAARQELENYKAQLRNTIGRKIDFTKVVGDGDCTIAFKIDSSGRLINRSFAKQSSNITLNDAVYAAVMATPSYNPPPKAYNSETLRLYIKFYNGNFEISLK